MCWPVIAQINTKAVLGNLEAIRRRVGPGTPICAAVKANAYGHGIRQVLPVLIDAGVERVAVANLAEALEVRQLGWSRGILCFGAPLTMAYEGNLAELAIEAVAAEISCTVWSIEELNALSAAAVKLHRPARVEIKIDTGMGRLGLGPDSAAEFIARAVHQPGVILEGVYTHFATADEADLSFAREQLATFGEITRQLQKMGVACKRIHAANSAAIFRLPESHLDMVRPGISVYGYWDNPTDERPADLTPAMRVVGRLIAVRQLPKGHSVGYGRAFTTSRESVIGVVPIGYGDGYRRLLGNDAVMTLEACRGLPRRTVPVVGRISMDLTSVDLTEAGDVRVGDAVTIIDDDPAAPNSVEAIARKLGTISYEITCLITQRVGRVAV